MAACAFTGGRRHHRTARTEVTQAAPASKPTRLRASKADCLSTTQDECGAACPVLRTAPFNALSARLCAWRPFRTSYSRPATASPAKYLLSGANYSTRKRVIVPSRSLWHQAQLHFVAGFMASRLSYRATRKHRKCSLLPGVTAFLCGCTGCSGTWPRARWARAARGRRRRWRPAWPARRRTIWRAAARRCRRAALPYPKTPDP